MIEQMTNLLLDEPKEMQEAVLELLKALKEAKGKVDPVEVIKNDIELISSLIALEDLKS